MKLIINASECDTLTLKIAEALRLAFQKFEDQLAGNYDGIIEHLWIYLELSEMSFKAFGKPPKPFRFQKRVWCGSHGFSSNTRLLECWAL